MDNLFEACFQYYKLFLNNFVDSYARGETPVPCIQCNQTVKFSDLLQESKNLNADALVTGHYAIRQGGLKDSKLFKAKDKTKDQSYFLFATLQDQLDYVRFPLGNYLKSEIREMAKNYKIQRYKGLGEMNPDQLWETTLDPDARTLLQVQYKDLWEADDLFGKLMGNNVEARRNFIQKFALEAEIDS